MPYGLTRFRATVVKPFRKEEDVQDFPENKFDYDSGSEQEFSDSNKEYVPSNDSDGTITEKLQPTPAKRGRGRPKGSVNRPKIVQVMRKMIQLAQLILKTS
ncbi:hypothetical protein OnM2_041056 [Erysiphe neolycopersici]|uniref:Uncharacterized protein n=1 Tax=Erysiphe neolycopersici TaxID=212602 RepID=A0A420HVP3_9PEZI|nr:hypothetical protein OnM2_041056 [Erysiphe neolycopersici]